MLQQMPNKLSKVLKKSKPTTKHQHYAAFLIYYLKNMNCTLTHANMAKRHCRDSLIIEVKSVFFSHSRGRAYNFHPRVRLHVNGTFF